MSGFNEDIVEPAGIETLKSLGWLYLHGSVIAPDGVSPQRPSYAEAVLLKRLEARVEHPNVPEEARAEVVLEQVEALLTSLET